MSWSDFSGVMVRTPAEVIYSKSLSDVLQGITRATVQRLKLCVRGEGHSSLQGVTDGLLMVNFSVNSGQLEFIGEGLLKVSSRTQLKEAKLFAQNKGWKIPVLQHFKTFSVGGSVSVGGLGGESIKYGTQVHHVKSITLVTMDSQVRHCSDENNSDLFQFALSGLGQLGIIEEVVYQLVPLLKFGRRCRIKFGTFEELVKWVENYSTTEKVAHIGLDYFFAYAEYVAGLLEVVAIVGKDFASIEDADSWVVPLDIISFSATYWTEDATKENFMEYEKKAEEYRIYNDYCFSTYTALVNFISSQLEFISSVSKQPKDGIFQDLNMITIYPVFPQRQKIPLNYSPGGSDTHDMSFDVGILFKTTSQMQLNSIKAFVENCLVRCIQLGGRPYNYGFVAATQEQCHAIYGADYSKFCNLKAKYDPDNLLEKCLSL